MSFTGASIRTAWHRQRKGKTEACISHWYGTLCSWLGNLAREHPCSISSFFSCCVLLQDLFFDSTHTAAGKRIASLKRVRVLGALPCPLRLFLLVGMMTMAGRSLESKAQQRSYLYNTRQGRERTGKLRIAAKLAACSEFWARDFPFPSFDACTTYDTLITSL